MSWLMIIALLAMAYGAVSGWKNGLLKELLSSGGLLLGLLIGLYFAYHFGNGSVVSFLAIMILTPVALSFVATLLNGILDKMVVLGSLNRLAGALIGVLKFAILFGAIYLAGQKLGLL